MLAPAVKAHGKFTPAEGTIITESPLILTWKSSHPDQWVRASDQDNNRFFDSGRQHSTNGQFEFDIPAGTSSIKVYFGEKIEGDWNRQYRTFPVELGGSQATIIGDEFTVTVDGYTTHDSGKKLRLKAQRRA